MKTRTHISLSISRLDNTRREEERVNDLQPLKCIGLSSSLSPQPSIHSFKLYIEYGDIMGRAMHFLWAKTPSMLLDVIVAIIIIKRILSALHFTCINFCVKYYIFNNFPRYFSFVRNCSVCVVTVKYVFHGEVVAGKSKTADILCAVRLRKSNTKHTLTIYE